MRKKDGGRVAGRKEREGKEGRGEDGTLIFSYSQSF